MSFWEKTKGFLLSPTETFNKVKEEGWGGSIGFFAKWLIIYAILFTIIIVALFATLMSWIGAFAEFPLEFTGLFGLFGDVMAVVGFISIIIGGLIGILIGSLWMHIWVYVCGGRKGVGQTIKAMAYGGIRRFY